MLLKGLDTYFSRLALSYHTYKHTYVCTLEAAHDTSLVPRLSPCKRHNNCVTFEQPKVCRVKGHNITIVCVAAKPGGKANITLCVQLTSAQLYKAQAYASPTTYVSYIHSNMWVCIYIHTYVLVWVHTYAHKYVHTYLYILKPYHILLITPVLSFSELHTHIVAYLHMYVYIYTMHICMYLYTLYAKTVTLHCEKLALK